MTNDNPVFRNQPRTRPVELADPLWEKQKGETTKAYEAFKIYRDADVNRSYAAVAKQLGKSNTLIERWGRTWHWVTRVLAYDRQIERERLDAEKEGRQRALMRQRAIAVSLQNIVGFAAKDLLDRYRKTHQLDLLVAEEVAMRTATGQLVTDDDRAKIRAQKKLSIGAFEEVRMTPKDMAAIFREGVHTERLVMGEPTEHRFESNADELLRKKIADAVADARLNHSEYPAIPLAQHLQWAAIDAGVSFSEVLDAAGLPRSGDIPPRLIGSGPAESNSVS